MTGSSRPVLKVVPDAEPDPVETLLAAATAAGDTDAWPSGPRPDPATLHAEISAHLARRHGSPRARTDAVRALADPADLAPLAAHAASVREAAASVRRQHTETAEDLGPLWDTWAGPAAEAVQNRVSALARSAHALIVELEDTADRLADAHDRIVEALEALADDLADERADERADDRADDRADPDRALGRCAEACARAWADVRRVLDGDPG